MTPTLLPISTPTFDVGHAPGALGQEVFATELDRALVEVETRPGAEHADRATKPDEHASREARPSERASKVSAAAEAVEDQDSGVIDARGDQAATTDVVEMAEFAAAVGVPVENTDSDGHATEGEPSAGVDTSAPLVGSPAAGSAERTVDSSQVVVPANDVDTEAVVVAQPEADPTSDLADGLATLGAEEALLETTETVEVDRQLTDETTEPSTADQPAGRHHRHRISVEVRPECATVRSAARRRPGVLWRTGSRCIHHYVGRRRPRI